MLQLCRDGVALAYEEAGRGALPILLVHDLGSDHTAFASQFEHFRRCHRTVAIDLRGHGQSGKPRRSYTIALLADDLAWLCYELGLYRPVVLGHGLGAMVALDLAARYPDIPAAIVAVAVCLSPSARSPALPQHVTACLLESIFSWDRAAATAACVVPILDLASGAQDAAPDGQPETDAHRVARLAAEPVPGGDMTLSVEVSLLVDAFVSELMLSNLGAAGGNPEPGSRRLFG